jgi:hypothetical protein
MVTGVTSAWGYPVNAVGGQFNTMLSGDHPLTYEESLTSYYPNFVNGNFQSPLLKIKQNAFGRKKRKKSGKNLKQLQRDLRIVMLI